MNAFQITIRQDRGPESTIERSGKIVIKIGSDSMASFVEEVIFPGVGSANREWQGPLKDLLSRLDEAINQFWEEDVTRLMLEGTKTVHDQDPWLGNQTLEPERAEISLALPRSKATELYYAMYRRRDLALQG